MSLSKYSSIAAIVLLPFAAQADARDDLANGVARCAMVTDSLARLVCYDALTPQLKAARAATPDLPVSPAPPASAGDNRAWYDPGRFFGTSPSAQTTPEQFGGEYLTAPARPSRPGEVAPPPLPAALDSITSGVRDYTFNALGRVTVVLDNGQVWQQLAGDSDRAHLRKDHNSVEISRGMIGSYNMVINNSGSALKVRRIK